MKKLSKDQLKALDAFHDRAVEAQEALTAAREALVEILTEAAETVRECESDAQSYFDERSESWQEGDKGQIYQEWITALGDRASTLEVSEDDDFAQLDEAVSALDPEQFPNEPEG